MLKVVQVKTQECTNCTKKNYFFVKLDQSNCDARSIKNRKKEFLQNFKQAQALENV